MKLRILADAESENVGESTCLAYFVFSFASGNSMVRCFNHYVHWFLENMGMYLHC